MHIGIDLDETISHTLLTFIPWYNATYHTAITYADFSTYDFCAVLNISEQELDKRLLAFYHSSSIMKVKPNKIAQHVLEQLRRHHTLSVITARCHDMHPLTKQWLDIHFPHVFSYIFYTGQMHSQPVTTKKMVCKNNNIDVFIDDHLAYIYDCEPVVKKTIVIDKPWNQHDVHVCRAYNWYHILHLIHALDALKNKI
ncbi:MAG: 5' nucleotidase, NT5C type [Candidatus Woesearchaeota archaeon]